MVENIFNLWQNKDSNKAISVYYIFLKFIIALCYGLNWKCPPEVSGVQRCRSWKVTELQRCHTHWWIEITPECAVRKWSPVGGGGHWRRGFGRHTPQSLPGSSCSLCFWPPIVLLCHERLLRCLCLGASRRWALTSETLSPKSIFSSFNFCY